MTAIRYRSPVAICVLLLSVATAIGQQRTVVGDRVQREAQAFALDEVRLRESPFKRAMKVLPDQPVSLVSTYWGGETGERNFDILVDGVKIANQTLRNNKPGQFFDQTYDIPPELTRNKTKITVRFQALPGNMAGGLRTAHSPQKLKPLISTW